MGVYVRASVCACAKCGRSVSTPSVRTQACIISEEGPVFDSEGKEGELHLSVVKQRNNGILFCLCKGNQRTEAVSH